MSSTTRSASYVATWVNRSSPVASPADQMWSFVVRMVSVSTGLPPSSSWMPAASRSCGSNRARRPAATSSSALSRTSPVDRCSRHLRPRYQPNAFLLQCGDEFGSCVLVLIVEDPGKDLDGGHARAEPSVDLGELDPDGPRSQDGDRPGDRLWLPDGLLVGPVLALLDPFDRRRDRFAPGGQDDPVRLDLGTVGQLDPMRSDHAGLLHEDPDAEPLEGLGPAARLRIDDPPGAVPNGQEVNVHGRDAHPEAVRCPGKCRDLGASEHDLGGNAAVQVAFAPQLVPLGQADGEPAVSPKAERDL